MLRCRRWSVLWLCSVLLLAGCMTHPRATVALDAIPAADRARAEHNLKVFYAVWDLVNRKHYEAKMHGLDWEQTAATFAHRAAAAPDEKGLYAILNEMLAPLEDSHTHALTPQQAQEHRTREFARCGFNMVYVHEQWVVTEVVPESPAGAGGVTPGWVVVTRNGEKIDQRSYFRASEGEEVKWQFLDQANRTIAMTLKAKRLSSRPLQVRRDLADGFVYLRFDEFDRQDRRWLGQQLRNYATAPGVVIDLRNNPGGETFSLGVIIGEFFDHSVDCGTFITRSGSRSVKNSWQLGSNDYRGQVAVLIDESSASAAEILAAVLQDHHRATIIGRKSAGAVLASWFYRLPDGGELQLSREDYLRPNGKRIEGAGVEPDLPVALTVDDVRYGRDVDLDVAVRWLQRAH